LPREDITAIAAMIDDSEEATIVEGPSPNSLEN